MLLLDLLAAAHGYVKDVVIMSQLGVSGKVANRALRHLQSEGLLQSGAELAALQYRYRQLLCMSRRAAVAVCSLPSHCAHLHYARHAP